MPCRSAPGPTGPTGYRRHRESPHRSRTSCRRWMARQPRFAASTSIAGQRTAGSISTSRAEDRRASASNSDPRVAARARIHRLPLPPTSARARRERAPLDLHAAAIRIAAQLAPAFDERRVQRRRAEQRMRAGRAGARDRAPRARESTRPMRRIASRPSRGRLPCAARPCVSTRDPLKALVRDRDVETGRLGDDGASARHGRPAPRRRCWRALRRRRRDDQPAGARPPPSAITRARQSSRRRRPSCPARRGRRAGRRESPGRTGRAMPATPTVSVWPQNISERPGARPSSTPTTFGRPGRDLGSRRRDRSRELAAIRRATSASPRAPGDERRIHRVDRDEIAATRMAGSARTAILAG